MLNINSARNFWEILCFLVEKLDGKWKFSHFYPIFQVISQYPVPLNITQFSRTIVAVWWWIFLILISSLLTPLSPRMTENPVFTVNLERSICFKWCLKFWTGFSSEEAKINFKFKNSKILRFAIESQANPWGLIQMS